MSEHSESFKTSPPVLDSSTLAPLWKRGGEIIHRMDLLWLCIRAHTDECVELQGALDKPVTISIIAADS